MEEKNNSKRVETWLLILLLTLTVALVLTISMDKIERKIAVNSYKNILRNAQAGLSLCMADENEKTDVFVGERSAGDSFCQGEDLIFPPLPRKCSAKKYLVTQSKDGWELTTDKDCHGCRWKCSTGEGCRVYSDKYKCK